MRRIGEDGASHLPAKQRFPKGTREFESLILRQIMKNYSHTEAASQLVLLGIKCLNDEKLVSFINKGFSQVIFIPGKTINFVQPSTSALFNEDALIQMILLAYEQRNAIELSDKIISKIIFTPNVSLDFITK